MHKPTDLDIFNAVHSTASYKEAAAMLGMSYKKLWKRATTLGLSSKDNRGRPRKQPQEVTEEQKPIAAGNIAAPDVARPRLSPGVHVFTAAQNNTLLHEDFFTSLLHLCEERNAQLHISTFTYNKSGFQNLGDRDDLWYDPRIKDYLLNESIELADDLVFCGELNILPTAVLPLSGLDNYSRHASSIVPHAKMQMRSVAVTKGSEPKFLYTTGAVTARNYIAQKAGQKASFHHVFGALLVEVDNDGVWFARQLVADSNGIFHDLTTRYTPDGVQHGVSVSGINWGDAHAEMPDEDVLHGAFNPFNGIAVVLKPRVQFFNDISDFRARNHHNIKDPHQMAYQRTAKQGCVASGYTDVANLLIRANKANGGSELVVVESNHDTALRMWLRNPSGQFDTANARLWHMCNAELYGYLEHGIGPAEGAHLVFSNLVRDRLPMSLRPVFLREDESYKLHGIECGMHGHRGPNGARGNANNLKNLNTRCNIGHGHSATIVDGVYMAGVLCNLDLGYNVGPSSWSHSHVLTYANGKRAIITQRGKRWKL